MVTVVFAFYAYQLQADRWASDGFQRCGSHSSIREAGRGLDAEEHVGDVATGLTPFTSQVAMSEYARRRDQAPDGGVRAFPDRAGALRLVPAVALQVTAIWTDRRDVDMLLLTSEAAEPRAA